jgi:hypothetical protein
MVLSRLRRYAWHIIKDLLTILYTFSFNYNQYSAIANLHTFQFTAEHALEFSVSISRCLVADLNTGNITLNHYEIFLPFLLQSPWNAYSILQSRSCTVLICTQLTPPYACVATCLLSHCLAMLWANPSFYMSNFYFAKK